MSPIVTGSVSRLQGTTTEAKCSVNEECIHNGSWPNGFLHPPIIAATVLTPSVAVIEQLIVLAVLSNLSHPHPVLSLAMFLPLLTIPWFL